MKIYIEWILLQALPAPQTRLEWIFALILLFLTIGTLGLKFIQEHYRRNRPLDDTNASNECKQLRNRMDVFDERFNLINDRLSRAESLGNENRRLIRKLINRVLNKSL